MSGRVRVLVPLDPWRLALTVEAVSMTHEGLRAVLHRPAPEARALLVEGDPYELQIEPDGDLAPAQGVRARLAHVEDRGPFLELAFRFTEAGPELLELLQ